MGSIACIYLANGTQKSYTFNYDIDLVGELEVGDLVVVEDINGYSVVKVKQLDVTPYGKGERSVIQKVDIKKIQEYRAKVTARKFILAKIKEEAEKINSLAVYENMAKTNPTMADMLSKLKDLE